MDKKLLKAVLSVPTRTGQETLLVDWLMYHINQQMPGCRAHRDAVGNVYAVKGQSPVYPCACAHTDTVHDPVNMVILEERDRLFALDETERPVGCGGDDKAGVFLCLELLKRFPALKVAFFVSEETGCHGSRQCQREFFMDVGYVMEFDSPCDDIMTVVCSGVQLFPMKGQFFDVLYAQACKFGVLDWQQHPYTDVSVLKQLFDFPCLNLPAGYFKMHSDEEFVLLRAVENSLAFGEALVQGLGCQRYLYPCVHVNGDLSESPVGVRYLHTHNPREDDAEPDSARPPKPWLDADYVRPSKPWPRPTKAKASRSLQEGASNHS